MINCYHHCLPSFSSVLEPLRDLLRKNKKWKWGNAEEKAFQECKLLKEYNLLIHYDSKKPLIVGYDAFPYGVRAVIAHLMPDRSEKPIMFASRTLSKAGKNYSQIELEGLLINKNICCKKVSPICLW